MHQHSPCAKQLRVQVNSLEPLRRGRLPQARRRQAELRGLQPRARERTARKGQRGTGTRAARPMNPRSTPAIPPTRVLPQIFRRYERQKSTPKFPEYPKREVIPKEGWLEAARTGPRSVLWCSSGALEITVFVLEPAQGSAAAGHYIRLQFASENETTKSASKWFSEANRVPDTDT